MDQANIIKFERGVLYLKLSEELNIDTMHIHAAIARIDRDGLEVVKGDSGIDLTATRMRLDWDQLDTIAQGFEMVQNFWEVQPLPHRHVLLTCGCTLDWDAYQRDNNNVAPNDLDYDLPHRNKHVWCGDHEESSIYRFLAGDFAKKQQEAM